MRELVGDEPRVDRGMALPGIADIQADDQRAVAGKGRATRPRSARRRNARESRRCRCRAACRCSATCARRCLEAARSSASASAFSKILRKLAGVEGGADRGLERNGRGRDQIALADLDRVDAGDARGLIDQPLDQVIGLRASGAAIGAGRHRVGVDALHADIELAECRTSPESSARNCWSRAGCRRRSHRRRDSGSGARAARETCRRRRARVRRP